MKVAAKTAYHPTGLHRFVSQTNRPSLSIPPSEVPRPEYLKYSPPWLFLGLLHPKVELRCLANALDLLS